MTRLEGVKAQVAAAGMGAVLAHVCKVMQLWILYKFKKVTKMIVVVSMRNMEISCFPLFFIAKAASHEVRRKRVGESLGAQQINAQLLKPLFLKLLATFQNDRMNAIINVHETSVRVTYAVAAVPLILFCNRFLGILAAAKQQKPQVFTKPFILNGLAHIEHRDLGRSPGATHTDIWPP